MRLKCTHGLCGLLFLLAVVGMLLPRNANAASCKTQSQLTAGQRDALSSTARVLTGQVQSGDVQAIRASTIPSVAANFGGISASALSLKPLIQNATITVDDLYTLYASDEPPGAQPTDFFCGSPIISFHFGSLPRGSYALAIVHATGVPKPQQISFILSQTQNRWMLAGFFSRPMTVLGHDGLWYWTQANAYAKRNMNWNAWFYYQTAAPLLAPVAFLSSPNLVKLRQESESVRPQGLPGVRPMTLNADGASFAITSIRVTEELGGFDLEVHYSPDSSQVAQLRDPVVARKQVVGIMTALLTLHPELRLAFRGLWVRADQGNASIYALDLPMKEIPAAGATPPIAQVQPVKPPAMFNPLKPESQPSLSQDRDPVLSPEEAASAVAAAAGPAATGAASGTQVGKIQKGRGGMYTLHEDVNEVVLNCTVVNQQGQLVKGLDRSDFRVWEDGVPQTIEAFRFQDLPVALGILVDNSGSMRDKRAAVDAAALDLVRSSNPHDTAFIVNFSSKAYLDQDLTSNISLLERGLSRFQQGNLTALYDAVDASADELAKYAKQPKQVLLIITDGADDASRLTLEQAVHRVQRLGGPVVYSIGLLYDEDKADAQTARDALETLSAQTGGVAYFPPSLQDVDEIAQEVARDIRQQYSIGYHSTRSASLGGFRTVRVEAAAPKRGVLIVRTRRGYYPRGAAKPVIQTAQTTQAAP